MIHRRRFSKETETITRTFIYFVLTQVSKQEIIKIMDHIIAWSKFYDMVNGCRDFFEHFTCIFKFFLNCAIIKGCQVVEVTDWGYYWFFCEGYSWLLVMSECLQNLVYLFSHRFIAHIGMSYRFLICLSAGIDILCDSLDAVVEPK